MVGEKSYVLTLPVNTGILVFLLSYRSLGLMRNRMFPIALLLVPLASDAEAPLHALTVTVDTPMVKVAPRAAGRSLFSLPRLDYQFQFQAGCEAAWQPAGLSVSIADSRVTFDRERLTKAMPAIEAGISVPAAQLSPLPLSGFCEIADDADSALNNPESRPISLNGTDTLTIAAALSANAALICSSDQQEQITYVSTALAVTLVCDVSADTADSDE